MYIHTYIHTYIHIHTYTYTIGAPCDIFWIREIAQENNRARVMKHRHGNASSIRHKIWSTPIHTHDVVKTWWNRQEFQKELITSLGWRKTRWLCEIGDAPLFSDENDFLSAPLALMLVPIQVRPSTLSCDVVALGVVVLASSGAAFEFGASFLSCSTSAGVFSVGALLSSLLIWRFRSHQASTENIARKRNKCLRKSTAEIA